MSRGVSHESPLEDVSRPGPTGGNGPVTVDRNPQAARQPPAPSRPLVTGAASQKRPEARPRPFPDDQGQLTAQFCRSKPAPKVLWLGQRRKVAQRT
jgi:hypothetical protein